MRAPTLKAERLLQGGREYCGRVRPLVGKALHFHCGASSLLSGALGSAGALGSTGQCYRSSTVEHGAP